MIKAVVACFLFPLSVSFAQNNPTLNHGEDVNVWLREMKDKERKGEEIGNLDRLLMEGIESGKIRNITPSWGGIPGVDQEKVKKHNRKRELKKYVFIISVTLFVSFLLAMFVYLGSKIRKILKKFTLTVTLKKE